MLPSILGIIFMAGKFYIVATPIGNLQDISSRALDILTNVGLILAEDTRYSQRLLNSYNIKNQLASLHEHNEEKSINKIVADLKHKDIALISDAGTPLISDPGYKLVRELKNNDFAVIPIPGPSALIAALSASGLPTDKFCFEGFLPKNPKARQNYLHKLRTETRTMIFYESPKRVIKTLELMLKMSGEHRKVAVARELSKKHENIIMGNLADVHKIFVTKQEPARGEFVIVLDGVTTEAENEIETAKILKILLDELPASQAIRLASKITDVGKNKLYATALNFDSTQD